MSSSVRPFVPALDDETNGLLHKIRIEVEKIGRKSVKQVIEIGRLLDHAADVLQGRFTVWVRHECGVDPRTALGYRKLYRAVEDRAVRTRLFEQVPMTPSTAILLASAPDEVLDRVLKIGFDNEIRITGDFVRSEIAKHAVVSKGVEVDVNAERTAALRKALRRTFSVAADKAASLASEKARAAVDAELNEDILIEAAQVAIREVMTSAALTPIILGMRPTTATTTSAVPATPREQANALAEEFDTRPTVLEICAGAGGMAYGLERAGFRHTKLIEFDRYACESLLANGFGEDAVLRTDVRGFDGRPYRGKVDLVAGGPPCQPFSAAGQQRGPEDSRDLFLEAIRLVREIQPKAFLFENVVGLTYGAFSEYRAHIIGEMERAGYKVLVSEVHARQFHLVQKRRRILFLGLRPEYAAWYRWPKLGWTDIGTSATALLKDLVLMTGHPNARQWVATPSSAFWIDEGRGTWDSFEKVPPTITAGSGSRSADMGQDGSRELWQSLGFDTTRVYTMEEVQANGGIGNVNNRDLIPITWEMIAAMQGFPPDWQFAGPVGRKRKQIGNAVPPVFAQWIGLGIRAALEKRFVDSPEDVRKRRPRKTKPVYLNEKLRIPGGVVPNPAYAPYAVPMATESLLHDHEIEGMGFGMGSRKVG